MILGICWWALKELKVSKINDGKSCFRFDSMDCSTSYRALFVLDSLQRIGKFCRNDKNRKQWPIPWLKYFLLSLIEI